MNRYVLKNVGELKHAVLECVAAHDGQWYWYQLDRALIATNPHLSAELMTAIQELETDGFIRISQNPERPDLPVYWVTDAGNAALAARSA